MINKRGISPIIATVLLLGFAVALATTVFLWMQGQTKTMSESTVESVEGELQCQNVRINVLKKGTPANPDDPLTCNKLELQNQGYLDINSVSVREFCVEGGAKSREQPIQIDLEPKKFVGGVETTGYKRLLSETFCSGGTTSCVSCTKVEVMPIIQIQTRKVGCKDRTILVKCS